MPISDVLASPKQFAEVVGNLSSSDIAAVARDIGVFECTGAISDTLIALLQRVECIATADRMLARM